MKITPREKRRLRLNTTYITFYILLIMTDLSVSFAFAQSFEIISKGQPVACILIGQTASAKEEFAASELNYFVSKYTEQHLEQIRDNQPIPTRYAIVIGTPESNQYVRIFENRDELSLNPELGSEGYIIKSIKGSCAELLIIAANSPKGTIYGTYDLVEMFIERLTGLEPPVDLDFYVPPSKNLSLPFLSISKSSKPFYPVRITLGSEDPDWLSHHRINIAAAEGVWTGTGVNDGLGTAFKYVDNPLFEDFQDESRQERLKRIDELRSRFRKLVQHGIEPYLFMYVTGEPTKAWVKNRPQLLGPKVYYNNSQKYYRPLCWSNPDTRQLIKDLVKEIVATYPNLAGFHLRSWGNETRACNCERCRGRQQELLWQIYFDIIDTAQQIRSDFKFYISGYNQSWLKDPDFQYAEKLPSPVIFSQKWGIDGEPTTDPQLSVQFTETIGELGHSLVVLSHDTEEVMPLWMVESDLFVEGVRKYSSEQLKGLAGFTLQGPNGLAHVDKLISAKVNWDVDVDHRKLMENYFTTFYGKLAAKHITQALLINSWTLSNYFSDYAGTLSITGDYNAGSAGFATRFWALIGSEPVADVLAIPELELAEYASQRLKNLLPQQQLSANKMMEASEVVQPVSSQASEDFEDAEHIMQLWVALFESRLKLVDAVKLGCKGEDEHQVEHKLKSAIEYSEEVLLHVKNIKHFVPIFNYTDKFSRSSLVEEIEEEIEFLSVLDPKQLVRKISEEAPEGNNKKEIYSVYNCPNPFSEDTVFTLELTSDADEVDVAIYTINGRLIRKLTGFPGFEGYNEIFFNGRDENGRRLSNGVYFYKLSVDFGKKIVHRTGKFAVLR